MNFEDELQEKTAVLPQEREISLGTGTILAIFFALTLICATFFGFGYSMGRRSEKAAKAAILQPETTPKADNSAFSNFKAAPVATSTPPASTTEVPADASTDHPSAETVAAGEPAAKAPTADNSTAPAADTGSVVQPTTDPDGTWMVQVSATTRKPDAEALSKVLVRQGFTTSIRPDADQKFHVRVGPFTAKKDADTTRKLLIASGYKDPFLTPR